MPRLVYFMLSSLDGFIGDGEYDWSEPSAEVLAALTADVAGRGTQLLGRRVYETMAVWETDRAVAAQWPDYAAAWQAAEKVVFSSTLAQVGTRRTRLERRFDASVLARLAGESRGELTVSGPTLAAEAFRQDLVDAVELLWCPTLLGGGIPVFPAGVRRYLALREERRFDNGMVLARYDVAGRS